MQRNANQRLLLDEDKIEKTRFVVIGAGAIGSFFIATASKMGARDITVYDDDSIEDHNIANQLYPIYLKGKQKVDAIEKVAFDYGEAKIKKVNARWNLDNCVDGDIIVAAVDDMDVRKAIWDHYKTRPHALYLEGRMGAQVYRVFGIDPTNRPAQDYYETTLYPQSEATEDLCGEKSIIYTVLQIAAQMNSQVKRFIMGQYRPTEVNYDCSRDEMRTKYHMEEKLEVFEDAPEELVTI